MGLGTRFLAAYIIAHNCKQKEINPIIMHTKVSEEPYILSILAWHITYLEVVLMLEGLMPSLHPNLYIVQAECLPRVLLCGFGFMCGFGIGNIIILTVLPPIFGGYDTSTTSWRLLWQVVLRNLT
jgi:hypothetical protein